MTGEVGSDDSQDLERRLAALTAGKSDAAPGKERPSALAAVGGVAAILGAGFIAYLALPGDKAEVALQTARPAEFQSENEGFGGIEPLTTSASPVEEPVVETGLDAELRAQLAALQRELETLRNAPTDNAADTAALAGLTEQVAALRASSEEARQRFEADVAERDRQLERLRSELEIAQLGADPALADLERRRAEAAEFEEARIQSSILAFGGGGADGGATELADRTIDAGTNFVLNGASPVQVTQAQAIVNPSNTVLQGTMIQAVTETALDSSLPGAIRALVSEDVHSYDGSRILIPRGSRLIGRYRSGLNIGQQRVTIAWDRIIMPTNQTVQISAFGGDELGRSGVTGFVDSRFGARFGSAALISIIGAAPEFAAAQVENETVSDVGENVGDDLTDATGDMLGEYLSIGPVIYVDQGERITVMVDRDLEIF